MGWMRRSNEDEFGWDSHQWERGKTTAADFAALNDRAAAELRTSEDPTQQARCVQALAFVVEHGPAAEQGWAHTQLVGYIREARPVQDAAPGQRRLPDPARHAFDVVNRPEEGRELNLEGVTWCGLDLRDVDLSGANLTGGNLSYADLTGADLSQATLDQAVLDNAQLTGANLSWATLRDASMCDVVADHAVCTRAVFTGVDARDARFAGADLSYADLTQAQFNGADLSHADLRRASLVGSQMVAATLTGATLETDHLNQGDFTGVQLKGTVFENSWLLRKVTDYVPLPGLKKYEDAYTADRQYLASSMPELLAAYDAALTQDLVDRAAEAIVERLAGPPDLVTDDYDVEERLSTAPTALSRAEGQTPEQLWHDICAHVAPQTVDEHWPAVQAALHRVQEAGRDPNALLHQALADTPQHDEHPGRNLHYRLIARDDAAATPRATELATATPEPVAIAEPAAQQQRRDLGPRR